MTALRIKDIKSIIGQIQSIINTHQNTLMELDSVMGDGDLGFTMTKAFNAAQEEAEKSEEMIPGKLLMRIGMIIAKTSPSTMGTLVATGFMKGGKAIEQFDEIGSEELAVFFEKFVQSMMDRGKSVPGNKTILDTLFPAAQALRLSIGEPLLIGMLSARDAALKGLKDSTMMKAQHGRAAYYQENSIGKQDGGATVGTYIVEGFYQYILNQESN
jgi:phosphoenolpyruvate---glycerone phosphotransferase subunit DhaL